MAICKVCSKVHNKSNIKDLLISVEIGNRLARLYSERGIPFNVGKGWLSVNKGWWDKATLQYPDHIEDSFNSKLKEMNY